MRTGIVIIITLCSLLIGLIYFNSEQKLNHEKMAVTKETSESIKDASQIQAPIHQTTQRPAFQKDSLDPEIMDHTDRNHNGTQVPDTTIVKHTIKLIQDTNLRSIAELKTTLDQMRQYPAEVVQDSLLQIYENTKTKSAFSRTKVLWFAKRNNGPKLREMWSDILLRQTYSGPNFDELQKSHQHMSIDARAEFTEELIAIKALGQLARNDMESLRLLKNLAKGESEFSASSMMHRKAALKQIKKISYTTLTQVKNQLARD